MKRLHLYLILLLALTFHACKKEDVLPGNLDNKTLGAAAHDLLSAATYKTLVIQVSYMPGYPPDETALAQLKTFLNTYLNKPGGIQVITKPIAASGKAKLTISDVVQIEKDNRSVFTQGSTIAVHVLITDSYYSDNSLAIAYRNTAISLFGKFINDNSGGPGQINRTKLYTNLLEHEFGHLLGLVNNGTPMLVNHEDPDHRTHCSNPACLMYYGVEPGDNLNNAAATPPLDDQCKADLKANGGK